MVLSLMKMNCLLFTEFEEEQNYGAEEEEDDFT